MNSSKSLIVYGVNMSSLQNMMFSKYISNNNIAMNTKTADERTQITLNWLNDNKKTIRSLDYKVTPEGLVNCVEVFENGKTFFEIECLANSPYSIEEEIQNWLDENGYDNIEFNFNKIKFSLKYNLFKDNSPLVHSFDSEPERLSEYQKLKKLGYNVINIKSDELSIKSHLGIK